MAILVVLGNDESQSRQRKPHSLVFIGTCPYRIVLFGSVALDTDSMASDINLLFILDTANIAQTYEERIEVRLLVRESLRAFNRHVPIDLVVYTRGEYEFFQRQSSSLLREIEPCGKTLYGKAN